MGDFLIFTEVVNCGDIGKNAIESFYKFHDLPITVIGLQKDKFVAEINPKIKFIDVSNTSIFQQYHSGHVGTAAIWANLINQTKAKKIIHFDSDVIFRGNIVDKIIDLLDVFDLVGPIRNYKYNPNNRDDVRNLFELTSTFCFGFNREKITPKDTGLLKSQILNCYNPHGLNNIDYFDIVMQEIILNGGKRYVIDNELMGGPNYFGKRENKYGKKNMHLDYGDKIIHYASVGSGKFYYENNVNVVHTYKNYALEKYALYCKTIFGKELPGVSTEAFREFYE